MKKLATMMVVISGLSTGCHSLPDPEAEVRRQEQLRETDPATYWYEQDQRIQERKRSEQEWGQRRYPNS